MTTDDLMLIENVKVGSVVFPSRSGTEIKQVNTVTQKLIKEICGKRISCRTLRSLQVALRISEIRLLVCTSGNIYARAQRVRGRSRGYVCRQTAQCSYVPNVLSEERI